LVIVPKKRILQITGDTSFYFGFYQVHRTLLGICNRNLVIAFLILSWKIWCSVEQGNKSQMDVNETGPSRNTDHIARSCCTHNICLSYLNSNHAWYVTPVILPCHVHYAVKCLCRTQLTISHWQLLQSVGALGYIFWLNSILLA